MSEYVPTTDEVRECWVTAEPSPDGYASAGLRVPDEAGMYAEFDAWLDDVRAAARREGQAEAWEEAVNECYALGSLYDYDRDEAHVRNPYRQEADQ